jgi:hypothetical protein
MTGPMGTHRVQKSRPRQATLVMRDSATVECGLYLNDGQALAPYLSSRKGGWVNVVNAHWAGEEGAHNHAVLQADHILAATSTEGDIPMSGGNAGRATRDVDITMEDGSHFRGTLNLSERQRLSDYLTACGKFLPVLNAMRVGYAGAVGDIAINCAAVRVIRDARVFQAGSMDLAAEAASEAAAEAAAAAADATALQRAGHSSSERATPVTRDVVRRVSGSIEVITEGRVSDRRSGKLAVTPFAPTPAVAPPIAEPTTGQRRAAKKIARHWLVQLAARKDLLPPDPTTLSASPPLDEIWHGLAERNEMVDAELAVFVAEAYKLPVANLDAVRPEALVEIPAKVARSLGVLPVRIEGRRLVLAVSDPTSMDIEQQLHFVTRLQVDYEIAPPSDIRGGIDWYYGVADAPAG